MSQDESPTAEAGDDLALVRRLRAELEQEKRRNSELRGAVLEAGDKFWVLHFYIRDEIAKACCLKKYEEMVATEKMA